MGVNLIEKKINNNNNINKKDFKRRYRLEKAGEVAAKYKCNQVTSLENEGEAQRLLILAVDIHREAITYIIYTFYKFYVIAMRYIKKNLNNICYILFFFTDWLI